MHLNVGHYLLSIIVNRMLQYVFASMVGSVLTVFVMSLREAGTIYMPLVDQSAVPDQISTLALAKNTSCLLRPLPAKLRHGIWHVQVEGTHIIIVYGAYFDDRPGIGRSPIVRVFGVSSAPKNATVICHLWYKQFPNEPIFAQSVIASPGRGYRSRDKTRYQEYVYSCPVTSPHVRPINISLSFHKCHNSTIHTPIFYSKKPSLPSVDVGVCVATSYGDIDPSRIIEWVELLRLLGVGEINVYVSSVANRTLDIFRFYSKLGIMVIHDAPPPILEYNLWPRKLAVIASFNDCLYRNMYRYRHLIIIDFDEIIIPRHHYTYPAMLAGITKFHKELKALPGVIVFRNAYFFSDFPPTPNTRENLNVMKQTTRVEVSKPGYSVKSIMDPRTCIIAWNHYCLARVPGTQVVNVHPHFATNHHYKKCHFSKMICDTMMRKNYTDNMVLKYRTALERRLEAVHMLDNSRFIA